jgi:dCTP deaminase
VFLSADEILSEVTRGALIIEPFDRRRLKPASYVLSLGDLFRSWNYDKSPLDVWAPDSGACTLTPPLRARKIVLEPQAFILSITRESLCVPEHLMGLLSTMSHIARFGVSAHRGSYLLSPGFGSGKPLPVTLELTSMHRRPLILRSDMPICHVMFARVNPNRQTLRLSKSIYEERDAPCAPLLYEEFAELFRDVVDEPSND